MIVQQRQALDGELREMARYFHALKDILRLRILVTLAGSGEMTVTELARTLHISQPLVSFHLRPLRVLGMLYLRAPAWPKGIGDLDLALEHLEKAVKEFPAHPANCLFYAEALKEDDRTKEAKKYLYLCVELINEGNWGEFGVCWKKDAEKLR